MCLFSRDIRNRSRFLHWRGYRDLISVKCGKCSECRKEKELEWQHRSYAEFVKAKKNNGYTMFFTMTYDEFNVPRIGMMRCFSRQDICLFRKRLRSAVVRYKDSEGNTPFAKLFDEGSIKIIIASEYGGRTFRPHYHCLIFVSHRHLSPDRSFMNAYLSPHLLAHILDECWQKGHITVGSGTVESGIVNSQGAIDYVSKYMGKDDDFTERLEQRKHLFDYISLHYPEALVQEKSLDNMICDNFNYDDFSNYLNKVAPYLPPMDRDCFDFAISSPKSYTISDEVFKQAQPFHVQSQGFGLCVIDNLGRENILRENKLWMPDMNLSVSEIPIPQYIQRHLFYNKLDVSEHYKFNDGKKHYRWVLTEEGVQHKLNHLDESLEQFSKNIREKIEEKKSRVGTDNGNYVKLFNLLNDSEKLDNFATYIYIYRNNSIDLSLVSDYRAAYKQLLYSNFGFYSPDKLEIITEEICGSFSISRSFFKKTKTGYCFYDYMFIDSGYQLTKYKNEEFEELYSQLVDKELLDFDVCVNDYFRKIRQARSRMKLLSESYLVNPLYINQINISHAS